MDSSTHNTDQNNGKESAITLAGIDEAGFGPILGPLVVSSCTFSVPRALLKSDMWEVLKKSISRKKRQLAGRILITDSKKAYSKSTGTKHLERAALAVLGCLGYQVRNLRQLTAVLSGDPQEKSAAAWHKRLQSYPWYQQTDKVQPQAAPKDIAVARAVLSNDMNDHGIGLTDVRSSCLDVGFYNDLVRRVNNKASVLFIAAAELIRNIIDKHPENDIHIFIDRQGGRVHYRENLMRSFEGMSLRIISEDTNSSSYELFDGKRYIYISFSVGADDAYMPVALASMVSKYLREMLMGCINSYFMSLVPAIRPTAGYWKDGQRFIKQLKENLTEADFDSDKLIRSR